MKLYTKLRSTLSPRKILERSVSLDSLNIAFWGRFLRMYLSEWLKGSEN